jgi:hypothetical protein
LRHFQRIFRRFFHTRELRFILVSSELSTVPLKWMVVYNCLGTKTSVFPGSITPDVFTARAVPGGGDPLLFPMHRVFMPEQAYELQIAIRTVPMK